VASATPNQCASCSMNPECSTHHCYPARARTASRAVRPATPRCPGGSIADATPGNIDSSGALREALPLRARPTTTRPGQPRRHISRAAGGGGCARRSLPPRGSRGRRGSRTARVGADALLFRAGELYELVAAQSAAPQRNVSRPNGPGRPPSPR
jgi:hypothetical protein